MALSEKFKDIIQESSKEAAKTDDLGELQKQTEANLLKIINRLSGKAINNLDEIKVNDVKDIKDLTTIYKLLTEDAVDSSLAPAINTQLAKFYSVNFNVPNGDSPKPAELDKKLDDMDSKDVDKLIKGHAKALNDRNLESFGN